MRALLIFGLAMMMFLGGCVNNKGAAAEPKTWEFDLFVHASSSDTVPLYEKNDGNQSRAVAITFQADPAAEQTVPGPEIRVKEGDTVIIRLHNDNGLAHTLHLHGGLVPWESDGVDYLTQMPIRQGEMFTYTFPSLKAGTYWYHCHVDGAHHIDLGMYGAFIVEERNPTVKPDREYVIMLDEWDNCHVHGNTDPITNQEPTPDTTATSDCYYRFLLDNLAQNRLVATTAQAVPQPVKDSVCPQLDQLPDTPPEAKRAKDQAKAAFGCDGTHDHGTPPPQQTPKSWWYDTPPVYNPQYNTYLVNGRAFPDTPVMAVKQGETVLFRIINAGSQMHSWHPHGHTMMVTHKDGYPLAGGPQGMDTLSIGPGERYDYLMTFNNPGLWAIHDQNGIAMMNDNAHPGGMMTCIAYDGWEGVKAFEMTRALDCNHEAVRILEERGQHQHPMATTPARNSPSPIAPPQGAASPPATGRQLSN